jgi:hypothetical protein
MMVRVMDTLTAFYQEGSRRRPLADYLRVRPRVSEQLTGAKKTKVPGASHAPGT